MLASNSIKRPESIEELISPSLAAALDQIDVNSRKLFPGKLQGERRSKARGKSIEFEDYRQYSIGDDLRHIDWNVLARLDKFFIRVFQEEQDLSLHIVLDASASMDAGTPGSPSKLIVGQRLAMALGYMGLVNNNRVEMTIFGSAGAERGAGVGTSSVRRLGALRSRRGVQPLAKFLLENTYVDNTSASGLRQEQAGNATFTSVLKTLAASHGNGRGGRGLVVIISDVLLPAQEGYQTGLGYVASMTQSGGWDATLLQVLSPGEIDPSKELDGSGGKVILGDLRLTDSETGRECEVTVSAELLKKYRARFADYQQRLSDCCSSRGLTHVVVSTDTDITTLLLDDLRRRGVLG